MWMTRDGMLVTGTNGSQLWDTAFAAQALVETGLADEQEYRESATKILEWLDHAQIQENPKHHHTAYRQATKGAWYDLFLIPPHQRLHNSQGFQHKRARIHAHRLHFRRTQGRSVLAKSLAVIIFKIDTLRRLMANSIVTLPNQFLMLVYLIPWIYCCRCNAVMVDMRATRSPGDRSFLNLSTWPRYLVIWPYSPECFTERENEGNVMVEHTYPECTTSVVTALRVFQRYYPAYRKKDIEYVDRIEQITLSHISHIFQARQLAEP
jgi:lanosterol synthase